MAPSTKYFMADSALSPESRSNATMAYTDRRQQLDAEVHGQQAVGGHQHEDAEQRGERRRVVARPALDVAVSPGRRADAGRSATADEQERGELEHDSRARGRAYISTVEQQRATRCRARQRTVSAAPAARARRGRPTPVARRRLRSPANRVEPAADRADRRRRASIGRDGGQRGWRPVGEVAAVVDGSCPAVVAFSGSAACEAWWRLRLRSPGDGRVGCIDLEPRRRPHADQRHRERQAPPSTTLLAARQILEARRRAGSTTGPNTTRLTIHSV